MNAKLKMIRITVFLLGVFQISCWSSNKPTYSAFDACFDYFSAYYGGTNYGADDPCLDSGVSHHFEDLTGAASDHCEELTGEDFNISLECHQHIVANCPTISIFFDWFFDEVGKCIPDGEAMSFSDWLNDLPDYDGQWPDYPECFEGCINNEPPWDHPDWYQ